MFDTIVLLILFVYREALSHDGVGFVSFTQKALWR